MDHTYFREGSYAVLLIHGISGSPRHFRNLIPVIPKEFGVCNIQLDGHSGTPKDLSRSSMAKWKAQVAGVLQDLFSRNEKVVIVAHSMGTLFAIQAAIEHPDRIAALFLLAVPTRPWLRISTICNILKVNLGIRNTPQTQALFDATDITLTPKLWQYIGWIPRMIELLAECRRTRNILSQLTVPTQTFQSQVDEMVSIRSCLDLTNPCIRNTVLYDSGHFAYGKKDMLLLQNRLQTTLANLTKENLEL